MKCCTKINRAKLNTIYFDTKHGSFWSGSSNNAEDYGIG